VHAVSPQGKQGKKGAELFVSLNEIY